MAGNANSGPKREKPFREALQMEIKAAGEDHKALRRIASNLLSLAYNGDLNAIKEIADRLDGRAAQEAFVQIDETKTVIRSPSPESSTDAWMNRVTKSSGNLNGDRKLNS